MSSPQNQLERLLRSAAQARSHSTLQPLEGPSAAWLLARVQRGDAIPPVVFLVFQRGLVAACILLMVTGVVATREIRQHQESVISLAQVAKSQLVLEFVP